MKKLAPKTKKPVSPPSVENDLANYLPPEWASFAGKPPIELMCAINPHIKAETIAGLMYGIGFDTELPIPEWAKKASKQFWKYYFPKDIDPFKNLAHAGALFGLCERIFNEEPTSKNKDKIPPNSPLLKPDFFSQLLNTLENEARSKSPDEAAEFYAGRAVGAKVKDKIGDAGYLKMQKRAPIYLCLAVLWTQFESFTSAAEGERWLRAQKVIGEAVTSREVNAAFSIVGLRYRGPGRPKKPKTDASNSANQDSPAQ